MKFTGSERSLTSEYTKIANMQIRNYYYHPDMQGLFLIKAVLPIAALESGYTDLWKMPSFQQILYLKQGDKAGAEAARKSLAVVKPDDDRLN